MSPQDPAPRNGDTTQTGDEVAERRARIKHVIGLVKRVGYLCLLGAIIAFAVALATSLAGWAVTTTIVLLVAACVILPVPIVIGYGIRAADREDRQAAHDRSRSHGARGAGGQEFPGGHGGSGAP